MTSTPAPSAPDADAMEPSKEALELSALLKARDEPATPDRHLAVILDRFAADALAKRDAEIAYLEKDRDTYRQSYAEAQAQLAALCAQPGVDDRERARRLANKLAKHFIGEQFAASDETCRQCIEMVEAALSDERAAARLEGAVAEREACAQVARGGNHAECDHGSAYLDGRLDAEAAIRARTDTADAK